MAYKDQAAYQVNLKHIVARALLVSTRVIRFQLERGEVLHDTVLVNGELVVLPSKAIQEHA